MAGEVQSAGAYLRGLVENADVPPKQERCPEVDDEGLQHQVECQVLKVAL